ncbi:MAG TPA: methyltransferase domain-containing protein [Solirubrobacteraceae bacterium]|nr:methyltransferase domain-containing protein [Solirubrobacteraceae bacterium]
MSDELTGLKGLQRAIWSAGDYDAIAELFWDVGAVVAETAAIEPGMRVLDVATGTGNAAIRAAEAGAQVVGLDLVPELFADARRREALAGVSVEWIEGDAEALPFADESFDRVLSTFGVMFAPRHDVAAAELVRSCRSGGMIVLANWTPGGFFGRMFAMLAEHLPESAPPGGEPPAMWGDERHVRALLGGQAQLALERRTVDFVYPSRDEMIADYEERFGPLVLAKRILEPASYAGLVEDLRALFEACDAGDGEVRIPAEYLLVSGLRP